MHETLFALYTGMNRMLAGEPMTVSIVSVSLTERCTCRVRVRVRVHVGYIAILALTGQTRQSALTGCISKCS